MQHLVEEIIKKYGTHNPFEIAKAMDILVVAEPLGEVDSYFSPTLIHVNSERPQWYQEFVLACQIYNVLKGNEDLCFVFRNRYDYSKEAVRFGVLLLTDFDKLEHEGFEKLALAKGIPADQIDILRKRFNRALGRDENGQA